MTCVPLYDVVTFYVNGTRVNFNRRANIKHSLSRWTNQNKKGGPLYVTVAPSANHSAVLLGEDQAQYWRFPELAPGVGAQDDFEVDHQI